MKFACPGHPVLKVIEGDTIVAEFVGGFFETTDKEKIASLKRIEGVEVVTEPKTDSKDDSKGE